MKNYKEIAQSVFERAEQYEIRQKKKRKMLISVLTPACCVCLVAVVGFGIWQNGQLKKQPISTVEDAVIPGTKDWYGPEDIENKDDGDSSVGTDNQAVESGEENTISTPNDSGKKNHPMILAYKLNINEIVGTAGAAKLFYDPQKYRTESITAKEMADYLGLDLSKLNIKNQFNSNGNFKLVYDKQNKVVYDTSVFYYKNDITILASRVGVPYDTVYELEKREVSNFGTMLESGEVRTNATIGTDNKGFYYADFKVNGTQFRVTMDNCQNEEYFATIVNTVIGYALG